ncbi:MAG TPA: carboxyl transferase domain-containing protein, partial [Actinomycetota bacterium]|nr:carboxyl transferase domain-containing protein [Actinomycetota bacterium]
MADQAEPSPPSRAVTYHYEGPDLRGQTESLRRTRDEFLRMGGSERVQKQHAQGKLTVRERLDRLFDGGSFAEIGLLAHHQSTAPSMQGKSTPADGCVCGIGRIDGRRVAAIAYDFTVMAGS